MTPELLTADTRATESELEERRLKVLTLRLRRYSQTEIARVLQVDHSTVSRDLAWIAANRKEMFGTPAKLQVEQEIGEAIDVFRDAEASAFRDFNRLGAADAKARNACLRTAILARQMRVNLLQNLGFINRQIGSMGITLRADAVRHALRDEGLLVPERALLGQPDEDEDGRPLAAPVGLITRPRPMAVREQ